MRKEQKENDSKSERGKEMATNETTIREREGKEAAS
jgi:hypothetical protein